MPNSPGIPGPYEGESAAGAIFWDHIDPKWANMPNIWRKFGLYEGQSAAGAIFWGITESK
jgi:hypothetical protein